MKRLSFTAKLTLWYACFMAVSFMLTWFMFERNSDLAAEAYYREELKRAVSAAKENASYEDGWLDFEPLPEALDNLHVAYFTWDQNLLYGHICADTPLSPGNYSMAYDGYERHRALWDEEIEVDGYGKIIVRVSISMKDAESITDRASGAVFGLIPATLIISLLGGYMLSRRAIRPVRRISSTANSIMSGEDLKKRIPLPEAQDEIGVLSGVINGMLSRLENAFEREKQFTGDISHELRTPVAAILSSSEAALMDTATEADKTGALKAIRSKAVSMSKMIQTLLMLSRMDAGKIALEKEPSDLSDIAQAVLEEVKARYENKPLTVRSHFSPAGAVCDPMLMAQLFVNLTENAFRYTKDGESIEIMTFANAQGAVFVIENRGVGFDKHQADRIFDRFYTVSDSRSEGGNGLGLSIAKAIANLHGASLSLDTEKDAFVRFTLILPG